MSSPYEAFLAEWPAYASTEAIDRLREKDYRRLDDQQHVYLDYTGGSLYAESQLHEHAAMLAHGIFGNPHSGSPSSLGMTALVERSRRAVLDWFGASPDVYTVVFTSNATGALKLVGESFPFAPGGQLLLTFDNHNSVNGIREFATAKGATVEYAPLTRPDLRVDRARLHALLDAPSGAPRLFAFPAQSNFSGVRHPLDLIEEAQRLGWTVLLDAAAYVPTNGLDLSRVQPDCVAVSFYKMFGYPTGVGCLLVRNAVLPMLRRPWYSGGTVRFATVQARTRILSDGEAGFEDGTLNYLGIPAVEIGLRHLGRVGIEAIHTRVACLTGWLLRQLTGLRHRNGQPLVHVYGPTTVVDRGGTVAMNFHDPDGRLLDYRRIEELAGAEGISLRTGCFCNPGAGEVAEGLTEADIRAALDADVGMNLARFIQFMAGRGGKTAGALRVSLGVVSNFADVERFVRFVELFRDRTPESIASGTLPADGGVGLRDGS